MDDNVRRFPSKKDKLRNEVKLAWKDLKEETKRFLNKPMVDMTIGDSLILHTSTIFVNVFVHSLIQGVDKMVSRK